MNPRGRQYALAGTLQGWARLTELTPRQRRALVLAYRGLNPLVYSRYGTRQWAAPLPTTRLVIKDPFAILSIPAVAARTGALPVLLHRHPGAVLVSYRRMGWSPDLDELQSVLTDARRQGGPDLPDLPREGETSPAEAMGRFWSTLHDLALADLERTGTSAVIVSHQELATSGPAGGRVLTAALGVGWSEAMESELAKESSTDEGSSGSLHNFDRAPTLVAEAWRSKLDQSEVEDIERVTQVTRSRLAEASLSLRQG